MSMQVIDVGAVANDGTGDALRDAFTKVNQNTSELFATLEFSAGGLAVLTNWLTGTVYKFRQLVVFGDGIYRATVDHGSGDFATDLAAGKWVLSATIPTGDDGTDGLGYGGTSSSTLLIGMGSTVFATQGGLAYQAGARVRAASAAAPSNYMEGACTAYDVVTGLLTVNVAKIGGSGTFADWNISIAGDPGSGDLLSTSNLSDLANKPVALSNIAARGQGKETIFVPAAALTSRTTNGAAAGSLEMSTNKNMFVTKDFDAATQEFCQFEVFFPKSWNLGTVTFRSLWSHAATSVNFGVAWGLAGIARSDDDPGDVAFGTAQLSVDTGGTTNDIYISPESSAITIAGSPAAGDSVQFQLNRTVADAGDTMAIDARLHGIQLFFTTNAVTDA